MLRPEDAGYETARLVENAAIDRRPAAIVLARDADDVRATVNLAIRSGFALAVRGGGHSALGHGVADDAIVLDLSALRSVEADAAGGTAWVGAGATAGQVIAALRDVGRTIPFGDFGAVGVGGITQAGGVGWLVRRHGLTLDSLLAAEVVTAAGHRLVASAADDPDLFWAIRGGGGNFGVVTRLQFRLAPIDDVLSGRLIVPATRDVLERIIDVATGAPDALTVIGGIYPSPPEPPFLDEWRGRLVLSLRFVHCGPVADDPAILDHLRSLGPGVEDAIGRMPYPALFPRADGERIGTADRTMFMDDLASPAIEVIERRLANPSSPDAWIQLRVLGGAMARVPNDATAFGHRERRAMATIVTPFEDVSEAARHEAWTGDFEAELLAAGCGPGAYVGFLGTNDEAALHAAYPPATLARLVATKQRYDPGNLFRSNLNIRPDLDVAGG